jgi:hypothetical protein
MSAFVADTCQYEMAKSIAAQPFAKVRGHRLLLLFAVKKSEPFFQFIRWGQKAS